ncbi:MAG: hypothetical protein ACLTKI_08835, partial [Lachnospiraceae bacterium]
DMELAVTQTNLACLYEAWQEDGYEEKIDSCIRRAMAYLDGPKVKRDGYYAFTCRKCAGTFGHFGYFKWKKELEERADAIYERA